MIDVSKLDKAEVLAALYNASRPQGMGFLQYEDKPMTREEAAELLEGGDYFDYLKGRVMKIRIADQLDPWGYDRDNGNGACARAIEALVKTGDANAIDIEMQHNKGKSEAKVEAMKFAQTRTVSQVENGVQTIYLGADENGDKLNEAIWKDGKK